MILIWDKTNIYILYILILQCFLNNRHDVYALFHLKQTNKLLYQLSLNINVKINDIYIIKGKFTKRVTYINLCPKISYPKMLCKSVDMIYPIIFVFEFSRPLIITVFSNSIFGNNPDQYWLIFAITLLKMMMIRW